MRCTREAAQSIFVASVVQVPSGGRNDTERPGPVASMAVDERANGQLTLAAEFSRPVDAEKGQASALRIGPLDRCLFRVVSTSTPIHGMFANRITADCCCVGANVRLGSF
jgi:hypothetical protein